MARIVPLPTGLSEQDRQWIDTRIHWLLNEFGEKLPRGARIARPDQPAFQSDFGDVAETAPLSAAAPKGVSTGNWSQEQVELVEDVAEEVAGFTGLSRNRYELNVLRGNQLVSEGSPEAGDRLVEVQLDATPTILTLISYLGAQFSTLRLADHRAAGKAEQDLPLLAELMACMSGLGVCMANATLVEPERASKSQMYSPALSMPMFAYSLAVFAWLRDEDSPKWERLLDRKVQNVFGQAQAFLDEHGMHDPPAKFSASFFNTYARTRGSGAMSERTVSSARTQGFAGQDSNEAETEYGEEDSVQEGDYADSYQQHDEYEDDAYDEEDTYEDGEEDDADYAADRRGEESQSAGQCALCGRPTRPGKTTCSNCQTAARDPSRVRIGKDMELPDTSSWLLHFFLIVVGIALVLFAVSSLGQ